MYIFTVYASRISPWPLNQHVWITVSRHGTCFLGRSVMHGQRSVKRKAKCTHYVETEQRNWAGFWNEKIWSFLKTTTRFICFASSCCSLFHSSFSTRTSRCWGCIYALSSPQFLHQALALSFLLPSQLLLFWRGDNETASAATALRTMNLYT